MAATTVVGAALVVLLSRALVSSPPVAAFLQQYPGHYPLPDAAQPGFPAWAQWSHFLNFFFIALIIRTGLQVRYQAQPPAYWASRRGGPKISVALWLHLSLDVLWLLNGVLFVVLLFASGHWMRIVPTSPAVFPNALSALLQYTSLDWPTESGWTNYNSLQQLMYFAVVFVAAPLAAVTGARMSGWWPARAVRLNRLYPLAAARALHFPTMLFFSLFALVHVFLVLATGALRNLNHMFGGGDEAGWVGFSWFAAALFVTALAVVAARPGMVAAVARLFGTVSRR